MLKNSAHRRSAVLKWLFRSLLKKKNVAGYCEALSILVQQRPCASMRFTVGMHFSKRNARHTVDQIK